MPNPLESADVVLKDEGAYFQVIANTELGGRLAAGRETITRKVKKQFLKEAERLDATVFEF